MGASRPHGERADGVRQRVAEAALAVVREHPVADVQLAAIADRAGMRSGHVLYYFASRDDVLIHTVGWAEGRLAESRAAALADVADPLERLDRYVAHYLPDDRHDPVWKLWLEGWLRSASHAEFRTLGDAMDARWRADLVAALADAGAGPPGEELDALATRLHVLLDGLALHVMADHIPPAEAVAMARAQVRRELA
jgi:AcrR family transcriptional regulator